MVGETIKRTALIQPYIWKWTITLNANALSDVWCTIINSSNNGNVQAKLNSRGQTLFDLGNTHINSIQVNPPYENAQTGKLIVGGNSGCVNMANR